MFVVISEDVWEKDESSILFVVYKSDEVNLSLSILISFIELDCIFELDSNSSSWFIVECFCISLLESSKISELLESNILSVESGLLLSIEDSDIFVSEIVLVLFNKLLLESGINWVLSK